MRIGEALEHYEAHVRAQGLEDRTIKNRLQPIRRAAAVWGDVNLATISPIHIDRLFEGSDYAPRTRNLYLGHLRKFFAWCQHAKYMGKDDPTYGWTPRKVTKEDRLRIPVEQFPELLNAVDHPRDRAVIAVAMFTFMRGSEIQNLRIGDLNLTDSRLNMYRLKTKEFDSLPVCAELADEMIRWTNYYQGNVGPLNQDYYLLPSKTGPKWATKDGVFQEVGQGSLRPSDKMTHPYRVAQRALAAIGVDDTKNEGIHTLRRSGARALLDTLRSQGTESALLRVGAMLGHKDVKITAHYVGLNIEREQRDDLIAGQQMFPSSREPGLRAVSNG